MGGTKVGIEIELGVHPHNAAAAEINPASFKKSRRENSEFMNY